MLVDNLGLELGLHSLIPKQKFKDLSFIHKLLNNKISCPEILDKVSWHNPTFNARSMTTFYVSFHFQSYSFNENLSRMLREC